MINHEFANGSLARVGAGRNLKSSIERRAGGSPLAGHIWLEAEGGAANASPPSPVTYNPTASFSKQRSPMLRQVVCL